VCVCVCEEGKEGKKEVLRTVVEEEDLKFRRDAITAAAVRATATTPTVMKSTRRVS
jgi:uncharacterized protein YabE (DUF348 family)